MLALLGNSLVIAGAVILTGSLIPVYQLLNRLCRAGALAPGTYAITQRA